MKKKRVKHSDIGTLEQSLVAKPYGFCCNLKDVDSRLLLQKEDTGPLFPSSDPLSGGPDIKVRIQEGDDDRSHIRRSGRGSQRVGGRGGQRGGVRSKHRSGVPVNWSDQSRGRQRKQRDIRRSDTLKLPGRRSRLIEQPLVERIRCKRCKGPLKWFLEDEIKVAFDQMMNERQEQYHAEMKKNIKISKEKEKRRKQKKWKVLRKVKEDVGMDDVAKEDTLKEDTQENE